MRVIIVRLVAAEPSFGCSFRTQSQVFPINRTLAKEYTMIRSLLVAMLVALALAACGKKEEPAPVPAVAPAAEPAKPAEAAPAAPAPADAAKPADAAAAPAAPAADAKKPDEKK